MNLLATGTVRAGAIRCHPLRSHARRPSPTCARAFNPRNRGHLLNPDPGPAEEQYWQACSAMCAVVLASCSPPPPAPEVTQVLRGTTLAACNMLVCFDDYDENDRYWPAGIWTDMHLMRNSQARLVSARNQPLSRSKTLDVVGNLELSVEDVGPHLEAMRQLASSKQRPLNASFPSSVSAAVAALKPQPALLWAALMTAVILAYKLRQRDRLLSPGSLHAVVEREADIVIDQEEEFSGLMQWDLGSMDNNPLVESMGELPAAVVQGLEQLADAGGQPSYDVGAMCSNVKAWLCYNLMDQDDDDDDGYDYY